MPPVETADAFLDLLERSGLLRPDLIDPLRGYDPAGPAGDTLPQRLAAHLVGQRLLTAAQAAHLLRGRYRGFFITSKYKILDRLGTGGMGTVFLCEHLILQRLVAVKMLTGSAGSSASPEGIVQRFYREARAVAALDHPNIVRVFDVDTAGDQPFMVMEHVDGTDLHRLTTSRGGLELPRAVGYIRQAAAGLQHAHEAGLVHRDVKPSNILVDRAGVVKILDLGLARFHTAPDRNENLTAKYDESAILGTADFISPEQVSRATEADIRSDVYSLGCTFYFLLAGRGVFDYGSATQKLIWHQTRVPLPVTAVRHDVPDGLAEVITKMTAKRPEDRYQTPAEVATALLPFWTGNVPPPPTELLPNAPAPSFRLGLCQAPPPGSPLCLGTTGPGRASIGLPVSGSKEPDSPTNGPSPTPRATLPAKQGVPTPWPATPPRKLQGVQAPSSTKEPVGTPADRARSFRRVGLLAGMGVLVSILVAFAVYQVMQPDRSDRTAPTVNPSSDPITATNLGPEPKVPGDPSVPLTRTLTGGGSTFVAPLMAYWTDLYERKTGTRVTYKGVGSGKGLEGVTGGAFAFGCTDAPMTDGEIRKLRESGREVLHVPLVMGAVVPTYNLPGVARPLRFTGGLLADIYLGKVTRWNDPVVRANNPGVDLPDRPIHVVYRSDASGTTFIWTDYLSKVSGAWAERKIGPATRVTWPAGVGTGAEKSDGLAEVVTRSVGAIGYVELSHAIASGLPFGAVRNKMGNYVVPSLESVTAAAAGAIPSLQAEEFRLPLTDAPGEDSYPISGMTWAVLVFPAKEKPRSEAVEFLEWATHDGQEYAPGLRFAPLPDSLKVRLDATFYRLKRKS